MQSFLCHMITLSKVHSLNTLPSNFFNETPQISIYHCFILFKPNIFTFKRSSEDDIRKEMWHHITVRHC